MAKQHRCRCRECRGVVVESTPRVVETSSFARMMIRMTRAYTRRIATGDIASLPLLASLRDEVDRAIDTAVVELYTRHGYSWTDVGRELGITRQAARQRFVAAVVAAGAEVDDEQVPA
jgi:hypothetical protein